MEQYLKEPHGTLIWATGFQSKRLLEVLKIHSTPRDNWMETDVIVNYFRCTFYCTSSDHCLCYWGFKG